MACTWPVLSAELLRITKEDMPSPSTNKSSPMADSVLGWCIAVQVCVKVFFFCFGAAAVTVATAVATAAAAAAAAAVRYYQLSVNNK